LIIVCFIFVEWRVSTASLVIPYAFVIHRCKIKHMNTRICTIYMQYLLCVSVTIILVILNNFLLLHKTHLYYTALCSRKKVAKYLQDSLQMHLSYYFDSGEVMCDIHSEMQCENVTWAGIAESVYGLFTGWTIGVRFRGRSWEFLPPNHVQIGSGAHPVSYPKCGGGSFLGSKAGGSWSWPFRLHLVSTRKNAWSYTSIPQYVFMAWYLLKYREKFTFTFTFSL
jgi:hypothetical protein